MSRSDGERGGALRRWGAAGAAVLGAAAFAVFYYKYVPLVPGFQAFLAPVLAAVFLLTVSGLERGLTALVFTLPLINSLPYFFGIHGNIPHAPTALPLLLAFALGLAVRAALFSGTKEAGGGGLAGGGQDLARPLPMGRLIAVFAGLVSVSMAVTAWRYAGFYPFAVDEVLELVVNAGGVRAGGAIMSAVFSGLSYLTGILVFIAVWRARGGRAFSKKLLWTLTLAAVPALVFAQVQAWRAPALGNMPNWVAKAQINATFKDPNSLAGFLAAFVPVALGLALAARGWKKTALPLAAAVLGLAAVPHAGSRSGLAGLAAGLAVFGGGVVLDRLRGGRVRAGHRPIRPIWKVAGVAAGVVLAVLILGLIGSTLSERLLWSADVLSGDLGVDAFFNLRLTLWEAAVRMMAADPLSGVGVGAYIVELPNFLTGAGRIAGHTDSALNYFLQAGAELGLPGLLLALWIFGCIAVRAIRGVRSRPGDFMVLGMVAGLAAFFVSFVFHTFIGSFEIIAVFWLLAGILFRMTDEDLDRKAMRPGGESAASAGRKKRAAGGAGLVAAGLGVFLFGAVHLRNSLGPLSIEQRTANFGWIQDFGFYGPERDARGFHFRWSGKRVGLAMPDLGVPLVLPVTVMHPDIARRPVVIRVCRADRNFHPIEVLLEHVQRDKDWAEIEIPGRGGDGEMIRLLIEVDRTWSPQRDLGVPDPRELGFAMGEPWYRHHEEPPAPEFTVRSETYDVECWEGPWGSLLAGNAAARLRFRFEPGEGEAERVEDAGGERHAGGVGKGAEHAEGAGNAGGAALVLRMRGDRAAGVWPHAVIRLNGRVIGRTFVRSADWVNVVLYPEMAPGEQVLSVEFTNDFNNPRTGADRNLHLGPLTLLWLLEVSQNK